MVRVCVVPEQSFELEFSEVCNCFALVVRKFSVGGADRHHQNERTNEHPKQLGGVSPVCYLGIIEPRCYWVCVQEEEIEEIRVNLTTYERTFDPTGYRMVMVMVMVTRPVRLSACRLWHSIA